MPGKRRFGVGGYTANENLKQAAQRRLGTGVSPYKAATSGKRSFGNKITGGGFRSAGQAGPSTSPLAAKRQEAIASSIGKSGVTTKPSVQQAIRSSLNTDTATIKDQVANALKKK